MGGLLGVDIVKWVGGLLGVNNVKWVGGGSTSFNQFRCTCRICRQWLSRRKGLNWSLNLDSVHM